MHYNSVINQRPSCKYTRCVGLFGIVLRKSPCTPLLPSIERNYNGCNDNVSSIGNLTSPLCSNVNVMNLFPSFTRKKRSHGTRHYTPPRNNQVLFTDLLDLVFKPLGIHHIRTKLFSLPLPSLNKLFNECLQSSFLD